jgi:hypothetical protein
MKIVSVALIAGIGIAASALPASAFPGSSAIIGRPAADAGNVLLIQFTAPRASPLSPTGEYNGRSEERGGSFKRKTKTVKKLTQH